MSWVYEIDAKKLTQVLQKLFDGFHGDPTNGTALMVKDYLEGAKAFESLWDQSNVSDTALPQSMLKFVTRNQKIKFIYSWFCFYHVNICISYQSEKYRWVDDDTLDIFILDGMWEANHMIPEVELDGDDVGVEDDKCAAEVTTSDVPECLDEWTYTSWMAYHQFGPQAHQEEQSDCFLLVTGQR